MIQNKFQHASEELSDSMVKTFDLHTETSQRLGEFDNELITNNKAFDYPRNKVLGNMAAILPSTL